MLKNEALDERTDELKKELALIEMDVQTEGVTLATLMREGTRVTSQEVGGWNNEDYTKVCALTSTYLTARALGLVE